MKGTIDGPMPPLHRQRQSGLTKHLAEKLYHIRMEDFQERTPLSEARFNPAVGLSRAHDGCPTRSWAIVLSYMPGEQNGPAIHNEKAASLSGDGSPSA
jgi:hypothetical protein